MSKNLLRQEGILSDISIRVFAKPCYGKSVAAVLQSPLEK